MRSNPVKILCCDSVISLTSADDVTNVGSALICAFRFSILVCQTDFHLVLLVDVVALRSPFVRSLTLFQCFYAGVIVQIQNQRIHPRQQIVVRKAVSSF